MGQLAALLVPRPEHLPAQAVQQAYLAGLDEIPWETRASVADGRLIVQRTVSDSGYLHILWQVAGRGDQLLTTSTLSERTAPYNLPVELARGTLNRLRNQLLGWDMAGLTPPSAVTDLVKQGMQHFAAATTDQEEPLAAADHAQAAIESALAASDALAAAFADYAIRVRKGQAVKVTMLYGATLGTEVPESSIAEPFLAAFNTAVAPLSWQQIETHEGQRDWSHADGQIAWCQANELRIIGGPLLALDHRRLPDWCYLWEGDFDNILSMATQHVRNVVLRYKGRIHLWHCAAGLNTAVDLGLSEEECLRLTVRTIETVRNADPRAPVLVSINQPWGEYLGREERDLSPLHFADALVRADLGVSGIGLELNLGTEPGSTLPREALELGRQIDRWTQLGLPLVMFLTIPRGGSFTQQLQLAWLNSYLPLLFAKAAVHAVVWNQLHDDASGSAAPAGLFDSLGMPTAAYKALAEFRRMQGF